MSEKDITELLQNLFLSNQAPALTDSEVEAFLEVPFDCPKEVIDRMKARFVEKVIADLHKESIKKIDQQLPFGRWIEAIRQKVKLAREDIAVALRKESDYIEALETGSIDPWKLDAADLANILNLFRLHIKAFSELLALSFHVSTQKAKLNVAARRSNKKKAKAENEAISKVIDMHLASSFAAKETNEEVSQCLTNVRDELERRRIIYLLE